MPCPVNLIHCASVTAVTMACGALSVLGFGGHHAVTVTAPAKEKPRTWQGWTSRERQGYGKVL